MLIPVNKNIIVKLEMTNETDNGFAYSEEIQGDGQVVKCKIIQVPLDESLGYKIGTTVYIPFYAVREVTTGFYACNVESIIAIEKE
jgi:hypothetical protein